jgi:hypothetical protein
LRQDCDFNGIERRKVYNERQGDRGKKLARCATKSAKAAQRMRLEDG